MINGPKATPIYSDLYYPGFDLDRNDAHYNYISIKDSELPQDEKTNILSGDQMKRYQKIYKRPVIISPTFFPMFEDTRPSNQEISSRPVMVTASSSSSKLGSSSNRDVDCILIYNMTYVKISLHQYADATNLTVNSIIRKVRITKSFLPKNCTNIVENWLLLDKSDQVLFGVSPGKICFEKQVSFCSLSELIFEAQDFKVV